MTIEAGDRTLGLEIAEATWERHHVLARKAGASTWGKRNWCLGVCGELVVREVNDNQIPRSILSSPSNCNRFLPVLQHQGFYPDNNWHLFAPQTSYALPTWLTRKTIGQVRKRRRKRRLTTL
jgi:hypothetical protein